jgi:hypothetical protein
LKRTTSSPIVRCKRKRVAAEQGGSVAYQFMSKTECFKNPREIQVLDS